MVDTNVSMFEYLRAYAPKSDCDVALVRGSHVVRYGKLTREIDRVARGLYALGVREGDVVMCALPNVEQGAVILYAASRLGAVFSPVHPLVSEEEFEREVKLQNPKVAVLSDVNLFRFSRCLKKVKKIFCPYWAYLYIGLPRGKDFVPYVGDGEIPALYMHSGGTTGTPKTVVMSARSANSLVEGLLSCIPYDFGKKDGMLVTLPSFHGFGLIVGIHVSLSTNMKAVLVPKFSGEKAVKAIRKNGVTTMIAVPRMLKKLLDTGSFCGKNVSTLKNVYVGGDSLDDGLKEKFNARMKQSGADAVAQQGYGLTEVGSVCVLSPKDGKNGSVGRAINGVKAYIAGEDGKEVAIGEVGELIVATEQCMSGYLGDAASTDAVLTTVNGVRAVKTGDLFKTDQEGNLYYVGRRKRLIKISGMNVFPGEIERVAKQLPYVKECVATEVTKEGKTWIKLVVEGRLSAAQTEEIKSLIKHKLSHWHEPKFVVCVDSLPRTALGKVDFARLNDERKEN